MFTENERSPEYLKNEWQHESSRLLMAGESGSQVFRVQASSDQVSFSSHLSLSFQYLLWLRSDEGEEWVDLEIQFSWTRSIEIVLSFQFNFISILLLILYVLFPHRSTITLAMLNWSTQTVSFDQEIEFITNKIINVCCAWVNDEYYLKILSVQLWDEVSGLINVTLMLC